jgi:Ca2+-binding EF-hand superfamily protein
MKVFMLFDQDGTGRITLDDLRVVAEELGEELTDVIFYFFIQK